MNLTEKIALEVIREQVSSTKIEISKSRLRYDLENAGWGNDEVLSIMLAILSDNENIRVVE